MEPVNRRKLRTRTRAWPSAIARRLASAGVTPNQVSVTSIVFAALAGFAFCLGTEHGDRTASHFVIAVAGIQLRLLCNLLDGLLAIEGGLKSKTGDLFNEIPDRIADVVILLGAGYAIHHYPWGMELMICAPILALFTAYIRLLGGSLGLTQDFSGPMAKQHRMFALTVGALAGAVEHAARGTIWSLVVAMWVIVVGSLLTAVLRTRRIAHALNAR